MLTVEIKDIKNPKLSEVAIFCDAEGLEELSKQIEFLRKGSSHAHLMTEAWAGNELTEEKQGGEKYTLINHLRIAISWGAEGGSGSEEIND